MPVLGAHSLSLEVPDIASGVAFYSDAGLVPSVSGNIATLQCKGQDRESIVLLGGFPRKRLHHITLRANRLDEIARNVPKAGGKVAVFNVAKVMRDYKKWQYYAMVMNTKRTTATAELGNPQ